MSYAEGTSVSPEKSRMEIESTLRKYGASAFMSGWTAEKAQVEFAAHGRRIRFTLDLPTDPKDFALTKSRQVRSQGQREAALEAEVRRRWRALFLAIKAKCEAVETGIGTFEQEFLAHIVMPDGRTVGETIVPQVSAAYSGGRVEPLAIEA